ncbi:flavin-containing monooxygenase [Streptomyces sp. NPDC059349]|uniref:flavin-containing monooxygenase n=1 Tax=Streptomyces sp. NPDC059349 TaxID=3346808 RepID=UPI0036811AFB
MTVASRRVAVIGAGAGGLSAARHLLEQGHDVTVYEIGSHVGGLWAYDNDNGLSVAYASLHINSEPKVTNYRGYPFPAGTSVVPSHEEVCAYLNRFTDEFGIRERIRFRSRVTVVEPIDGVRGNGWMVGLDDGSGSAFDSVVVATGHQGLAAHPPFARGFTGEYLHSSDYREPLPFVGKRVLVVGVGNSGLDIAADLAPVAARTYVAARSPVLVMPRMMFGVPTARVLAKINKPFFPWIVQRQIMRTIARAYHGRMEQWGLRTPQLRTHPASNATFMAHVAYGRILCRPGVQDIEGRRVTFTDGTSIEVDTLIAATGYDIDLPFLLEEVSPVSGRRMETYKRVVHPSWPGLYFVGFFNVSGGANISMMDVQSAWVAALVSGSVTPPSEAESRADIEREKQRLDKRFPHAARYGLELEPRQYKKDIARELRGRNSNTSASKVVGAPVSEVRALREN